MGEPVRLSLCQQLEAMRKKQFSARELAEAYIAAIEAKNGALNAFATVTAENALRDAALSDTRIARGEARPLEGAPLAFKDLYCTKGEAATAGSRMLAGFIPTCESHVTALLREDGALSLGKLNMDEFAMGSTTETCAFGPVISPWQRRGDATPLVPGGSSGGSAAAVAAGMCSASLGSDTGGSIRQPAAFCGIVGVKPSWGRCSRRGMIAFASSLDQAGPLARNLRDAAIILRSMAGMDPADSTSADVPVPDYAAHIGRSVKGKRIGIPREYRVDGMSPEIISLWEKGIEWFREAGAEIVEISLPHTEYALPAYYIVAPAEASSNLARYDGVRYGLRVDGDDLVSMYANTRAEGFGAEVKRRILIGTYVLSSGYYDAYYLRAQKIRTLIRRDFDTAFTRVDAVLAPATPTAAFPVGAEVTDPLEIYMNDVFTVTANMAGLPAIAVPAGLNAAGLPLGLQIIGRSFAEEELFTLGHVIEQAAGTFSPYAEAN